MGRKRKDSSRTVIDPKLLPTNITPPPPPDLKLQVRGNPTSGYRVCTYFARWRPVVKETDSTPRKEGSCVATHVKTVGYIEKHKRSGKIIFVPDFYLEVPTLRYYDVYRDYDHCTYQLRPDWRETWYLTERSLYQPPEESLNLKQELSRLRKLVSAQKRAAAQGIALELDLEAPNDAPELGPQKEAVRGSYNQYMMGSIPTTDALQEGVYRAGDKERTEPSWAAQYALTMGEPSVAPNIVPAIAKAGKRAPVRAEPPGPDAYLSLTDDPNSEWHVKPQHDVLPPSQPQERLQRQAELDKILDPRQGKAPARKTGTKYRPQALKVESLPAGAPHSMVQPRPAVPEAAEPAHVSLTAQPGEHQDNELLRGVTELGAAPSDERKVGKMHVGTGLGAALSDGLKVDALDGAGLSARKSEQAQQGETPPGAKLHSETGPDATKSAGVPLSESAGVPLSELGAPDKVQRRGADAGESLRLSGAVRLSAAPPQAKAKGTLAKSTTKYRPKSSLQGATVVNVGTLRLQGTRKLQPDDEEQS